MRIVGGQWRGRPVEAPEGREVTRPTTDRVREAVSSMLLSETGLSLEGLSVLDAFAGSGAMGLELLSRGAARCTFVDSDRAACARVRRNLASLGAEEGCARVIRADSMRLASGMAPGAPFDVVLLDPPYATDAAEVASLVETLARTGKLAEEALVLYERDAQAPSIEPEGFSCVRQKRYGKTAVDLLKGQS